MKRKLTLYLLLGCMLSSLTACSGKESSGNIIDQEDTMNALNSTTDDSSLNDDSSVDSQDGSFSNEPLTMEDEMISKSLLAEGNNYRLKKVIEKARNGEDVTIAFIGGSITEGYNAGTKEIYAKLVYDFFNENYGTGDNVHYVNAGLSGTPSSLGLLRSDRDIFAYEPDLIFIEFAVNDGNSIMDSTGYESLVYKSLSRENEPAVILLMSVIETGYTCQDNMNLVGFNYDLARISVKNAIWEYIEDGSITWDDWSKDESHPNEWGQYMYAQFIIDYIKKADAAELDKAYVLKETIAKGKGFDHTKLIMIDRSMNMDAITLESIGSFSEVGDLTSFNEGWKYTGVLTENDPFKFTYTGEALYIAYKDTNSTKYGTAEVFVDGEYVMSIYANSSDGWGNPVTEWIMRENESATHTVEIRMAEDSLDKEFAILALGIVP